jgi:hypothetical protein
VQLIAGYNTELDREHLRFEGEETIKLLRYGPGAACIGWSDRAVWQAEAELLAALGILKAAPAIDAAVDNSFVQQYYRDRGIPCPAGPSASSVLLRAAITEAADGKIVRGRCSSRLAAARLPLNACQAAPN